MRWELQKRWRMRIAAALAPLVMLGAGPAGAAVARAQPAHGHRPNILLILADDLGYSDIGAFGSEIRTPNIDRIAREGARLTNFHAYTACSPSRAMLLTGVDSHRAGFGTMAGDETPQQRGRPGYETKLNFHVVTVADILRAAGYHTYMAGKWDMGVPEAYSPDKRGFEQSYALLNGSADHFERAAAMEGVLPTYRENGRLIELPRDFYSSRTYTDKLIEYIERNREDGRPFLAYAAYTAPHYPLQAPDDYIARYKGRYDAGYEAIRSERIARQRALGLIGADLRPAPQHPVFPAWASLPPELRLLEARRMEVYAGMIEAMDFNVGRLLSYLERIGQLDNTLIVFLSDNGPEGSNPLEWGWENWARQTKDLSVANMGRPHSYVWLGPGWAHVSATPWRLFKAYATEGGIRVPALVRYPPAVASGSIRDAYANILDVLPTLLEVGQARHPGGSYRGVKLYEPVAGKSMLPYLAGRAARIHGDDQVSGWELWNRRALRKGDWKIVWMNAPWGKGLGHWELYNLASDPTELEDVAARNPAQLDAMLREWRHFVRQNGVIEVDDFVIGGGVNSFHHYDWRPP